MRTRRSILLASVTAALLASSQIAGGQPAPTSSGGADAFAVALDRGRALLAASASPEDAIVIRSITIHVDPDLIRQHNAMSYVTSHGREVVVALSLAYELSLTAEAQYVERVYGPPGLMSNYFRHFEEAYEYSNRAFRSIEDFAYLDSEARARLRSPALAQVFQGWTEYALVFILAHEIGHHVRNALYSPSDPDDVKQQKERIADRWAAEAMLASGYSALHGVILVTELMEYRERAIPASYVGSHPPTPDRALDLLNRYSAQQHAIYQTPRYGSVPLQTYLKGEQQWAAELEGMRQRRAARTVANLERQSAAGDVDATEALAFDYMNGLGVAQDARAAAKYLENAASQGDFWAQSTLGAMYANGTLGAPDFGRARYWAGFASDVGEKAASANLDIIQRIAPPETVCQGACVQQAVRGVLQPCVEQSRAGCVSACTQKFGHSEAECVARYCSNLSDEQRYFARCYSAPSPEQWQACVTTCRPSGSASGLAASGQPVQFAASGVASSSAAPRDDFGRALQRVVEAALTGFGPVKGSPTPREAGDTSTSFDALVTLPSLQDCFVSVDDDVHVAASYTCDGYRGSVGDDAARAYQSLVQHVNDRLSASGAPACVVTKRQYGSRVRRDVLQCRGVFPSGVVVRVRQAQSVFASTGRTEQTADIWVEAPSP